MLRVVMGNVPDLESETARGDIVFWGVTEQFSEGGTAHPEHHHPRVCAAGSPGGGKIASTPWLIRLLVLRQETVAYLVRSMTESLSFYEFRPTKEGDVEVQSFLERGLKNNNNLTLPSSNYIVYPGITQDSCNSSIS